MPLNMNEAIFEQIRRTNVALKINKKRSDRIKNEPIYNNIMLRWLGHYLQKRLTIHKVTLQEHKKFLKNKLQVYHRKRL